MSADWAKRKPKVVCPKCGRRMKDKPQNYLAHMKAHDRTERREFASLLDTDQSDSNKLTTPTASA